MLDRVHRTPEELEQAFGDSTGVHAIDVNEMSIIFKPSEGSYADWLAYRRASDPEIEIIHQMGEWADQQEKFERAIDGLDLE